MQKVQDCLDFPIDTPSDAELYRGFDAGINQAFGVPRKLIFRELSGSSKTAKNRRKRERKAAKNARRITAKA